MTRPGAEQNAELVLDACGRGGDGDSFREADSLAGEAGRPFGATSEHPKHGLFPNEVLVDAFYHIYIYINKSCYGF